MELFFREYGDGEPLTILHGLFGAGGNWHTLSRREFGSVRRVVVPDLRNHGESPHDARMDYPSMAEDVIELWDRMGLDSSDLVGHSMGGKVAMQVALAYPERVRRLVVVDIAPKAYPRGHDVILEALKEARPEERTSREEVDGELAKSIEDISVRQFLLKNLRRTGDDGLAWQLNLDAIASSYDLIRGGLDAFSTFEGPTLFIRGGRSPYVREDDLELIRAYFPQAQLATIPQAGHWVHAEAPEEFAREVLAFLADGQA